MYLLDTHTLIWSLFDERMLPDTARNAIANGTHVYGSVVSLWEIAIKQSIGKLNIDASIATIADACKEQGFELLAIQPAHLDRIKTLPGIHGDPFDRLLIAQAQVEKLTLITKDSMIAQYDVPVLWQNTGGLF